jgi:hypothetical protein
MPSARDVILKHIDAVNGHDSDADPWAADAEMTAPGAQVSGRDNVIGFIGVFQEAFPDLRLEIKQLLTDGPAAAAEWTTGRGAGRRVIDVNPLYLNDDLTVHATFCEGKLIPREVE